MEACGTSGELRSHTFTRQPRNIVAPGPDLPARFLASVSEELAGMLLDQISINDSDLIAIKREVDCEVADKRGFPASALLASHGQH